MNLKRQIITGIKWNGILMVVTSLLHFVTLAILARLLAPSDFGLMGMITIVIGFTQAFADMGLSNAIIQRPQVPKNHLSSFFWINVATGSVIFVGIVLIRPLIVMYFNKPELSRYLLITAFTFLITPFGQIFTTLLKKELRFDTLSQIEMASALVYSVVAIGFALTDVGVLSLILGQLISSLFMVGILVFLFRKIWLPNFHCDIHEVKTYFRFGAFQMGRRVLNYLSANVDYIIIGRLLGPAALGFYTLAYQLVTFPVTKINPIVTKIAFPVFSKIQSDHATMRKGYCQGVHYISLVSFPILTGMFIVAPEFIRLAYGTKWTPSILIVQLLCFAGIFKSLGNPVGSIILAKGRADIGFYLNIFWVIIVSGAVFIGVHWGIKGVAVAILIVHLPLFFIMHSLVKKLIELTFRQYSEAIQLPLVSSGIMLAGLFIFKMLLDNMNELLLLIMTVILGVIMYAGSCYLQNRMILLELKSILKEN